jgi:dTDP-glucose pyrophosphorylase
VKVDLKDVIVSPGMAISAVMECINNNSQGIALAVDGDGRLVGTVTDGDIRRGLLRGLALDSPVSEVVNTNALVVPDMFPPEALSGLMRANSVRHMPLVDEVGRVTGLEVLTLGGLRDDDFPVAVLMAGGEGLRLRPLTETVPKPMLKVVGRPLLEIIVTSLRAAGFRRLFINVRYLGHVIEDYFGDGSKWDLEIHYLREPKPLGTAGSLAMIPRELRPKFPLLVINADILTRLNFGVFRDFHIAANYSITLCGRPFEVKIPFGYPVINGDLVTDFKEKPVITHLVNSGIYCLNPELLDEVPENQMFDMPELIRKACTSGLRVGVFPLREPFHEIGRVESYEAAGEFYRRHFATAHART